MLRPSLGLRPEALIATVTLAHDVFKLNGLIFILVTIATFLAEYLLVCT
jgi:hypothetical protein